MAHADEPDPFDKKAVTEATSAGKDARTSKAGSPRTSGGEDPLLKYVASKIVSARQNLCITQDQLAERAGCAPLTVTNIESGRKNMTLKSLSLLAIALGIEVRDLFPPALSTSTRGISDDVAKQILAGLGRIAAAVTDVETLISQETDQQASYTSGTKD